MSKYRYKDGKKNDTLEKAVVKDGVVVDWETDMKLPASIESGGGGGGGTQPGPNTVGTKEIQDDAIMMEDLNQSVKDKMITKENRVTSDDLDNFDV